MEETKTYNGWTNYETWCVNLWIDNEQGSHDFWLERAAYWWDQSQYASQVGSGTWTRERAAKYLLADELKAEFEDGKDSWLEESGKSCSVWADLIGAALSEVSWDEIAEHLLDECDKEVPGDDDFDEDE